MMEALPASAGHVAGVADLSAVADVVQDHAAAARLHARIDEPDHASAIAEALEGPALAPLVGVDVEDRPAGDHAGVVDQDVDVSSFLHDALAGAALGHVGRRR